MEVANSDAVLPIDIGWSRQLAPNVGLIGLPDGRLSLAIGTEAGDAVITRLDHALVCEMILAMQEWLATRGGMG
jgi:hypothetical protein